MTIIRPLLCFAALTSVTAAGPAAVASAAETLQSPTTAEPGTTAGFNCATSTAPTEPGNAMNAPGSAFNESTVTPGTAGTVYAGNGPGSAHSDSTAAVSQYDTACRELSSP